MLKLSHLYYCSADNVPLDATAAPLVELSVALEPRRFSELLFGRLNWFLVEFAPKQSK